MFLHQKDDVVLRLSQCVDQFIAESGNGAQRQVFLKCFMLMCPKSVFEIALTAEAWQAERAVLEQIFFRCFPELPASFT